MSTLGGIRPDTGPELCGRRGETELGQTGRGNKKDWAQGAHPNPNRHPPIGRVSHDPVPHGIGPEEEAEEESAAGGSLHSSEAAPRRPVPYGEPDVLVKKATLELSHQEALEPPKGGITYRKGTGGASGGQRRWHLLHPTGARGGWALLAASTSFSTSPPLASVSTDSQSLTRKKVLRAVCRSLTMTCCRNQAGLSPAEGQKLGQGSGLPTGRAEAAAGAHPDLCCRATLGSSTRCPGCAAWRSGRCPDCCGGRPCPHPDAGGHSGCPPRTA